MIKGIPLVLGDGNEYTIPPLTLGALEDHQESINQVGGLDAASIRTTIDIAHLALKRNYPEIARDQVRDLIDLENFQDVFEACMDVSGLKRKSLETLVASLPAEPDQGEAQGAEA